MHFGHRASATPRKNRCVLKTTIQRNSGRLTEASIPVLNLYYDLTKFRPAHGNVDSSIINLYYDLTKFRPAHGNVDSSIINLYYDLTKFRPAHGNVDSSTKLVLRFSEIPAGSRKTSIPVLNLYYDLTKFRPAHGNVDSRISNPQ